LLVFTVAPVWPIIWVKLEIGGHAQLPLERTAGAEYQSMLPVVGGPAVSMAACPAQIGVEGLTVIGPATGIWLTTMVVVTTKGGQGPLVIVAVIVVVAVSGPTVQQVLPAGGVQPDQVTVPTTGPPKQTVEVECPSLQIAAGEAVRGPPFGRG
jgi:hypothetical protein